MTLMPLKEIEAIDLLLQLGNSYKGLRPFIDCLYSPYSEWNQLVRPNDFGEKAAKESEDLLYETIQEATRLKLLKLAPTPGDDCSPKPWWHWYTRRTTEAGRIWLATLDKKRELTRNL